MRRPKSKLTRNDINPFVLNLAQFFFKVNWLQIPIFFLYWFSIISSKFAFGRRGTFNEMPLDSFGLNGLNT